jgi:hypothetical protein
MPQSLANLNDQRSNAPGLDLGDDEKSIAFQVTSSKTSEKINKTLKTVSERKLEFQKIVVLIIGTKQSSYTLDEPLCNELKFSEDNIWDIDELCRKTISLPLDRLQALYDLIRRDLTRVRIELEIPDEDGNFATSIDAYIEGIPKPQLSDFKKYHQYQVGIEDAYEFTPEQIKKHFEKLSNELSQLPRITREFYAFLLERRDKDDSKTPSCYSNCLWFNHNRLIRICRFPDLKDELILLDEHGFADIEPPMENNESPFVRISSPVREEGFLFGLTDYIEFYDLGYRKPIVFLDFSEF